MPRRLLRDDRVVLDDWQYLAESGAGAAGRGLILPFEDWLADKTRWSAAGMRLGVVLAPAHKVELLVPDLAQFALIAADFPGPSDGRGYTQGRLLRERFGFKGELRAAGYVRQDQLFFLARCGFNSFELPEHELDSSRRAFATFSYEYQPTNDAGLAVKPQLKRDTPASGAAAPPPAARP